MIITKIYFDDYCYLCSNTIRILNALDRNKKLKYYGLNSEVAKSLIEDAPKNILNSDSIIVFYDGEYFIKSRAIFRILKSLGGVLRVFEVFKIIPTKYLDKLYDLVAHFRYRIFGKRKSCYRPNNRGKN